MPAECGGQKARNRDRKKILASMVRHPFQLTAKFQYGTCHVCYCSPFPVPPRVVA